MLYSMLEHMQMGRCLKKCPRTHGKHLKKMLIARCCCYQPFGRSISLVDRLFGTSFMVKTLRYTMIKKTQDKQLPNFPNVSSAEGRFLYGRKLLNTFISKIII